MSVTPIIPDAFARGVRARHGAAGRRWLAALPRLLASCARRWRLTLGEPVGVLSHHYVVSARMADGAPVILKVHAPTDGDECALAAAALGAFDGHGAVRLLAADCDEGALLLERGDPGTPVRAVARQDDARATSIACDVMRQLWRPVPASHPFPQMADWNADLARLRPRFGGGVGPFPRALIEEMESLLPALTASAPPFVLLHGDVHHDNIIAAARQPWLAIDPKGVIGEPAYETGPLLFNPQPELCAAPDLTRILGRRVDQLAAELTLDRARIRGWGLIRATLAAWWHVESSGEPWAEALACAEALAALPA